MESRLNVSGRHLVITPDDHVPLVRSSAPSWVEIVPESSLIPSFPTFIEKSLLRIASVRTDFRPRNARGGWFRQQLLKFAAADLLEDDHYLCLDADLVVAPTVSSTTAFAGARSLWQTIGVSKTHPPHHEHQPTWFINAHKALGISDPGGDGVQVTPCFLSRTGVHSLQRRLIDRAPIEEVLVRFASHKIRRDWMTSANSLLPWTEFAMYCEWLRHTGEFDGLHFYSNDHKVYGPSLWRGTDVHDWRRSLEECDYNFAFVVAQSNRGEELETTVTALTEANLLDW